MLLATNTKLQEFEGQSKLAGSNLRDQICGITHFAGSNCGINFAGSLILRDQSRGVRVASGITPKLVILARRGKVECYTLAQFKN